MVKYLEVRRGKPIWRVLREGEVLLMMLDKGKLLYARVENGKLKLESVPVEGLEEDEEDKDED
jgi:hypothetical protein